MIEVGDTVKTPYGEGMVKDIRHDQVVVETTTWQMAGGQRATLYLSHSDVKPIFKVGDTVRTLFGVGDVMEVRDHGTPYVVQLHQWKLASKQSPVLYLSDHSLKHERDISSKVYQYEV